MLFSSIICRSLEIYYSDTWSRDSRPLYPHNFVEYVVLIPNDRLEHADILEKFLNSPLFSIWASSIGVFALVRVIFRKLAHWNHVYAPASRNDLVYIPFNTIGLSFGMTAPHRIQSRAELVLVLYISLFCLLAGILCTGFTLVNSVLAINSIEELYDKTEMRLFRPNIVGLLQDAFVNY